MTQPTNMGTGGAPKGSPVLKILLIVGGIVVFLGLGCCGVFTMCSYFAAKAVQTTGSAIMRANGVSLGGIPDNFPSDIPVYSGLKAIASFIDSKSGTGTVSFTGSGIAAADVVAFYKKEMAAKGWAEDNVATNGDTTMLVYSQGSRVATVAVTQSGTDTTVQMTYGKK